MGTYRHNADFLAGIAQLVEHLTCNQGVPSSTLGAGTILTYSAVVQSYMPV